MILQPVIPSQHCPILAYVERFVFDTTQGHVVDGVCVLEDDNEMFLVHRLRSPNGQPAMQIVPLSDTQHLVQLVPQFHGQPTHPNLTADTSLHLYDDFYLNNYFGKETFHAILSYQ